MATHPTRSVLRVFLASPGDVGEERAIADVVVADVNRTIGRTLQYQIDLHKWEDKAPGMGRPQSIINPDVDECDLFVGLLWERWGQPTGKYSSGFEEEFERARARHRETGEPQIWLVFKEPRPDKLTDPGPQLQGVLAFQKQQIDRNEVLFSRVKNAHGWERHFRSWLTERVLTLWQAAQAAEQQPVTTSPTAQSSASNESLQPRVLPAGSRDKAIEQIAEKLRILGKLIENDQLESAATDGRFLQEFDAARLHLVSSTWMSRRFTGDVLGTHEINQLYKYHSELEATPSEMFLIMRTLFDDSSNVVPGWFWVRELKVEQLSFSLFGIANDDSSPHLRTRAIYLLAASGIEPPDERWDLLPLANQPVTVMWAAYDYLAAVANLSALPLLDKLAETEDSDDTGVQAHRARLTILARLDPERGFSNVLAKPDFASNEVLRLLEGSINKISTTSLKEGIASPADKIRELSAAELAKREEMSVDEAKLLTKDTSVLIRKIAFEVLIRRGEPLDLERIKEAFTEKEEVTPWQAGLAGRLSDMLGGPRPTPRDYSELADSVVFTFMRTLPPGELLKRADWLDIYGPVAYRCLASDHYELISDYIRDDIKQDFQRIRTATFERLDVQYRGAEGVDRLKASIERLDDFIREHFLEAALLGLATHAVASDIEIARHYLSHRSSKIKVAALKIAIRFGTADDVPAFLAVLKEAWGGLKEEAAECALRLSSDPFEVAKTLTRSHPPEVARIGFRWLLQDHSTPTMQFFENLLNADTGADRKWAIHYLTQRITQPEMQRFLDDYLTRESYYYDVVVWLDRLLYAPPPFREMYTRQLQEDV